MVLCWALASGMGDLLHPLLLLEMFLFPLLSQADLFRRKAAGGAAEPELIKVCDPHPKIPQWPELLGNSASPRTPGCLLPWPWPDLPGPGD